MSYSWLVLEIALIVFLCYQVYTVRHAIWGKKDGGDEERRDAPRGDSTDD